MIIYKCIGPKYWLWINILIGLKSKLIWAQIGFGIKLIKPKTKKAQNGPTLFPPPYYSSRAFWSFWGSSKPTLYPINRGVGVLVHSFHFRWVLTLRALSRWNLLNSVLPWSEWRSRNIHLNSWVWFLVGIVFLAEEIPTLW